MNSLRQTQAAKDCNPRGEEAKFENLLAPISSEYRVAVDAIVNDSEFTHAEKIELIRRWTPNPWQESRKEHEEVLITRADEDFGRLDFEDKQRQHELYPEAFDEDLQPRIQERSKVEGLARATKLSAANVARRESSYPEASRNVPKRKSHAVRIYATDYKRHGTRGFHMARLQAEGNLPPDGLEDALVLDGRQAVREKLRRFIGLQAPQAISAFS